MVVNGRPLKRMKRRVTADLYDFLTFPAAGDGFSGGLDGPFRSNVRSFLSRYARLPPPSSLFAPAVFPHLLTWQIAFRIGDVDGLDPTSAAAAVALDVVEEDVTRSRSVYCDQCRVVGWSGHPVCAKRYHFIIRVDNDGSFDGYQKSCTRCGVLLHSSDLRCKSCHYEITADDLEDWMYHQLEATTHLLHGVVHTNGYGHLLRVNGREGGSKFLSGCDIMDFWDRLCKMLRVRKISVMDVSKKYGLEYRLLHAITNGHPWYGNWGYEFGAGSYALTANAYQKAVNAISTMPLAPFFTHTRAPTTHLQDVVAFYWSLSERRLATVRDLFCFVMGLLHDAHKQAAGLACKNSGSHAVVLDRWAAADIERVEHAMIKVLLAVGKSSWVTWRALRGAVCRAGPPELLDCCLKGLGGKSFDGKVVHTRCNPETNVVEYRVEGENNALRNISGTPMLPSQKVVSEDKLLRDLKFLYGALLHPETMLSCMPQAMQELAHSSAVKLLDCKQFVKDYDSSLSKVPSPFFIRVSCQVELVDQPKDYTAPPPELIVLPITATVTDLKIEATKAFQEAYVLFKRFQALELLDYGNVDNGTRVKFLVGMVGTVRVRGRCLGNNGLHQFRMERGTESWTVDCTCGAKDDDGERMLACDSCGVWQHTRCAGIHDFDTVPSKFVCKRCGKSSRSEPAVGRRCKEQMAASMDVSGGLQALTALPFSIG